MSLDSNFYSWDKVLLWGTFVGHCKKASNEKGNCKRFIHITIALIEFLPIISQIASIVEKIIVMRCKKNPNPINKKFNTNPPLINIDNNQNEKSEIKISSKSNLDDLHIWDRNKVKEYHQNIDKSDPIRKNHLIWSRWSDANLMPSMNGLRKISSHLVQKHALQNDSLIVCSTLKEFKEKLDNIQSIQGDFRNAFVIPTHSTSWGRKEDGKIAQRSEEFPQHIITIGVERRGTELHIALLDPMIRHGNETITSNNIGLELNENVPFTEQELVLSYILSSKIDPKTTTLYHSKVLREKSNGCWAFALKDAVAFLKSPSFFKDIKAEDVGSFVEKFTLRGIKVLPFSFMKTAQFDDNQFETYFRQNPDQDNPDARRKLAKHNVEGLNQRIGHATVKWIEKLRQ